MGIHPHHPYPHYQWIIPLKRCKVGNLYNKHHLCICFVLRRSFREQSGDGRSVGTQSPTLGAKNTSFLFSLELLVSVLICQIHFEAKKKPLNHFINPKFDLLFFLIYFSSRWKFWRRQGLEERQPKLLWYPGPIRRSGWFHVESG